jgi:hypothetical protein
MFRLGRLQRRLKIRRSAKAPRIDAQTGNLGVTRTRLGMTVLHPLSFGQINVKYAAIKSGCNLRWFNCDRKIWNAEDQGIVI